MSHEEPVGRAILPAAVFEAASRRLKARGSQDWLRHNMCSHEDSA